MIALGCDHGGFKLKESIISYLEKQKIKFKDFGCYNNTESVDYPYFAKDVADSVANGEAKFGILICTTGIGISMAANKVKGIRAAVCTNEYTAEMTRRHNNANILCMGEKVVDVDLAIRLVEIFLSVQFEGDKHARRVQLIADIENEKL